MKQTKTYILAMFAPLLLIATGCSDDTIDEGTDDTKTPVEFEAAAHDLFTRSIISSTNELQTAGFGVFAYYTEDNEWGTAASSNPVPDFMYNEHVAYSDESWTYSPLKYWPNNDDKKYVSFFAYAPYSSDGSEVTVNITSKQPEINYTWATDNDLLYANRKDCYKTMDAGYGTVTGRVPFNFHHAVALVEFKVRRKEATGSAITLKSLTINSNANTSGTFNLVTKTWASTSGDNAQPLNHTTPDIDVTASEDASAQTVGTSVMIPGTVTFSYTIKYTVGDNNYTRSADMTSKELEKNTKYTVVFVIDGDAVDSYVLRDREAEQW